MSRVSSGQVWVIPVDDMKQARAWHASLLDFETVYLHDDPVEGITRSCDAMAPKCI